MCLFSGRNICCKYQKLKVRVVPDCVLKLWHAACILSKQKLIFTLDLIHKRHTHRYTYIHTIHIHSHENTFHRIAISWKQLIIMTKEGNTWLFLDHSINRSPHQNYLNVIWLVAQRIKTGLVGLNMLNYSTLTLIMAVLKFLSYIHVIFCENCQMKWKDIMTDFP